MRKIIVGCVAAIGFSVAYAQGNPWVGLEFGYYVAGSHSNTASEIVLLTDPQAYDYFNTTKRDNAFLAGIGGGYQFNLPSNGVTPWFNTNRVGVYYNFPNSAKAHGNTELTNGEFHFADYAYRITTQAIWLDDELAIYTHKGLTPFVEFGLGVASNATSNYTVYYPNGTESDNEAFANKTVNNLAWRAGAGVSYVLQHRNWKRPITIALLYRYSDLGTAKTGIPQSDQYPVDAQALTGRMTQNEFMFQTNYNF